MFDFLIIGGGIAGVSAAARLAPLGSVLLVEAEPNLSYHASGRSAAMYFENYGNDAIQVLNRASLEHLSTCAGGQGVLTPRGLLTLAGKGQQGAFAEILETPGTEQISFDQARALVPILVRDACAGAALTSDGLDLDTDLLIQDFLRAAKASGTETRTDCAVTAISRDGGCWRVTTAKAEIRALTLVNAAGAWGDNIAVLAGLPPIGLNPCRRSIARTPAPAGLDVTGWPMLMGVEEDWFAKPDAGKWLISPADEDPVEPHDAWSDDMVLAKGIARYQDFVSEEVTRVETSWAGLRTFARDRTLVIGRDPLEPSFVWTAGQGGYGFQTAPAASELLASAITGAPAGLGPEIVAATSPDRLRK